MASVENAATVVAPAAPVAAAQPPAFPAPSKTSTAVYVGDLAPDVGETVLFEIFNAVAPVHNIRVCRNNVVGSVTSACMLGKNVDEERSFSWDRTYMLTTDSSR